MAVHGAAPSKIAPARYSLACSAGINGAKIMVKNSQAIANMLKGLTSQLTLVVIIKPLGWRRTFNTAPKSTCTIIGKIIAQISTATGIDTCAYSKRDNVSGIAGKNWPINTPITIAKATQSDRKRPNKPMPSDVLGAVCVVLAVLMFYSLMMLWLISLLTAEQSRHLLS